MEVPSFQWIQKFLRHMEVHMEKISRIVPGNSRVASTDLKNAAAVRPGAPGFGRPMGESTVGAHSATTTAARAVSLHNEMVDKKKTGGDQVVQQMADQFFMTRIARPPDERGGEIHEGSEPVGGVVAANVQNGSDGDVELEEPVNYTPRGSYVDVRA